MCGVSVSVNLFILHIQLLTTFYKNYKFDQIHNEWNVKGYKGQVLTVGFIKDVETSWKLKSNVGSCSDWLRLELEFVLKF